MYAWWVLSRLAIPLSLCTHISVCKRENKIFITILLVTITIFTAVAPFWVNRISTKMEMETQINGFRIQFAQYAWQVTTVKNVFYLFFGLTLILLFFLLVSFTYFTPTLLILLNSLWWDTGWIYCVFAFCINKFSCVLSAQNSERRLYAHMLNKIIYVRMCIKRKCKKKKNWIVAFATISHTHPHTLIHSSPDFTGFCCFQFFFSSWTFQLKPSQISIHVGSVHAKRMVNDVHVCKLIYLKVNYYL